jgi:nitrate reductase NapAB chaperone NapD
MPIKSYLAHPCEGKKDALIANLSSIAQCELLPAENEDVVIVITDAPTEEEDQQLKSRLDNLEALKLLVLVSGFDTPKNP